MTQLSDEQLLLEAVGLIDRLAKNLGVDISISSGKRGVTVSDIFYLVKVNGIAVAGLDPVVALYEALGQRRAA